ncbi:hypothetical protein AAHE18_06G252900 [Arachis hypogaea]
MRINNNMIMKSSPRSSSTPMDPRIWSKLPPEILEYILSFLPLKTFLNLRSTCKSFWSLIFTPPFINKHSSSSSSSSSPFSNFLFLSHPQFHHSHFTLYDCNHATWRNISLSLTTNDSSSLHHSSPSSSCFTTLVSSGGLFCLSDPTSCSLLVCNLLAKTSRKIQYPSFNLHLEHLTFVTTPKGKTWHWLPRCPSLPLKCSCGFKWFSFVPNLYAAV